MASGLENLLGKYNLYLDARKVLQELELKPEPDPQNPDLLVSSCPLHKKADDNSLKLDKAKNTFYCEAKNCSGHAGGDLILLHSLIRNVSYEDAGLQMFNMFGLEKTENTQVLKRNLYISFSEKLTTEDLTQAAKNILLAACNEYPDNLVIISRLINIYTREGDKQRILQYLLKAGKIVAHNKNYNSARTALKRVFAMDPDNAKARELLADIMVEEWTDFYLSPHAPQGEESLLDSLNDIPLTPSLRVNLTGICLKNNRLKIIERLYSDLPEDLDDEQIVHLKEVADQLESRSSQYEDPVDLFLLLADLRIRLGDYESAKKAMLEVRNAIDGKGMSERREKVENRLRNFEDMLLKKEYDYAQVLMQTGKYEEALQSLKKTLESGSMSPELANMMIHCHFKRNNFPEAHRLCVSLADLYQALGKYQESALALYHGLLFQPAHKDTIVKLIEIFKLLGDNDIAEQVAELAERQVIVESRPRMEKIAPQPHPAESPPHPKVAPPPAPLPPSGAPGVLDIQLPFSLRLYTTTSSTTDRINLVESTTLSVSSGFITTNCGNVKIPGIQPVSINFVLQNCQIQGHLRIPDQKEPVRLFGKIVKVQNRLISTSYHKIVTIELQESDDPGMRKYQEFIRKLSTGELSPAPPPEPPPAPSPKPPEGGVERELLVSTRFLDEAGEEKTPDFFYANTVSLSEEGIVLNFGELTIAGVPAPSQNFFLKNSTFEMTIPLPEPNITVRLFGLAKNIRNKVIRGKHCRIVDVGFAKSPERDRQLYLDYVKGFHS